MPVYGGGGRTQRRRGRASEKEREGYAEEGGEVELFRAEHLPRDCGDRASFPLPNGTGRGTGGELTDVRLRPLISVARLMTKCHVLCFILVFII